MPVLQTSFDAFLLSLSSDPITMAVQFGIAALGAVAVYLLFFTVRDILLRTRSLLYQLACIALVAALPIVGFFLYLLVRPARTVKERQMERMLKEVLSGERKITHALAGTPAAGSVEHSAKSAPKKGFVQKGLRRAESPIPAAA